MATINGTSGNDFLSGADQDDVINGLGGNDLLFYGKGADSIYGGGGNDIIRFDAPTRPNDGSYPSGGLIDGGDGYDIVDASNVPANDQRYFFTNGYAGLPALQVSADAGGSGHIVTIANVEEVILDIPNLNNPYGRGLQIHVDSPTPFLRVSTGRGMISSMGSATLIFSSKEETTDFTCRCPVAPTAH
ncbi:hypothetical protein ACFSTI_18270 [Rhizorhabdus histidinilytica]